MGLFSFLSGGFGPAEQALVQIGKVPWPLRMEDRHLSVSGATGAGKTVFIRGVLSTIRQRGDDAIVVDSGGELLHEFGQAGDVILSPVDGRSRRWDPVLEMETSVDASRLALALVPAGESAGEEEWNSYSRTLICACLRVAKNEQHLEELLFTWPSYSDPGTGKPGLDSLLAGTPAGMLFEPGAGRMLASIRGIVGSKLAWLPYASATTGAVWTAREWAGGLDDPRRKGGVIWLPVRADHCQMLRPFVSAVIQQSVLQILSLPPSPARRIWLVWDELGAYPRVSDLIQSLTQGRKFGLRVVLGYQSVSQLVSRYGLHDASTMLSCVGTHLVLRQGDAQSGDWGSKLLGSREVIHRMKGASATGVSSSELLREEALVLPSELARLPDLTGWLRVPGDYPIAKVKLAVSPPWRTDGLNMHRHVPAPWLAAVGMVKKPTGRSTEIQPGASPEDSSTALVGRAELFGCEGVGIDRDGQ